MDIKTILLPTVMFT